MRDLTAYRGLLGPSFLGLGEKEKKSAKPKTEPSMRIYLDEGKETITEQMPWPETIKCPKCKDKAELFMVVEDPRGGSK